MKLDCPRCGVPLLAARSRLAPRSYACPSCAGRTATVESLQPYVEPARLVALWDLALRAPAGTTRCPGCRQPMRAFQAATPVGTVDLDACRTCRLLWFDATELAKVAPPVDVNEMRRRAEIAAARGSRLPPAAAEILARARIQQIRDRAGGRREIDGPADLFPADLLPAEDLSWVPDLLAGWARTDTVQPASPWVRLRGAASRIALRLIGASGRRGPPESR